MSGIGKRFKDAGYLIPKPLIKINGKEIIIHVVNMFQDIEKIIFICNENHIKDKDLNLIKILKSLHKNTSIIPIEEHKKGPIHAIIEGKSSIDLAMPTIVNYCDFNALFNFSKFKETLTKDKPDGSVFTYTGFHPHMLSNTNYAYVKKFKNNLIDIQEKKPYTKEPMKEEVSSGTYFFKTGALMLKYFRKTIDLDLKVNGEYYVSMAYKPMIKDGLKINSFLIDYFMQWGTPSDLEEFNWHSNIFEEIHNRYKNHYKNEMKLNDGCLMMPMAGQGSRFQEKGFKTPKPFIKVSGQEMFIKAIKDLPRMRKIKIISRKEIVKNKNLINYLKKENLDAKIRILENPTDGQAITCLKGMEDKDIITNKPLIISACDMGIIFDKEKYQKLIKSKEIDIIVWGCRGYPNAAKNPSIYSWIYEKDNLISGISVKRNINNPKKDNLLIGTFTFKKASYFRESVDLTIKSKKTINGEYYVDDVINKSIEIGLKVALFEVDYFICWGTPDELAVYNYWESCFNKWSEHPFKI